jgi:hypothetical protein
MITLIAVDNNDNVSDGINLPKCLIENLPRSSEVV